MTLDEAIAKAREKAKEHKSKYDKCPTRMKYDCEMCFHEPKCDTVANECEQLAEWLEDYKRLAKETEQDIYERAYKDGLDKGLSDGHFFGYNKAIDNFEKEICKMIVQSENNGNYRFYAVEIKQAIADIEEHLKAGDVE